MKKIVACLFIISQLFNLVAFGENKTSEFERLIIFGNQRILFINEDNWFDIDRVNLEKSPIFNKDNYEILIQLKILDESYEYNDKQTLINDLKGMLDTGNEDDVFELIRDELKKGEFIEGIFRIEVEDTEILLSKKSDLTFINLFNFASKLIKKDEEVDLKKVQSEIKDLIDIHYAAFKVFLIGKNKNYVLTENERIGSHAARKYIRKNRDENLTNGKIKRKLGDANVSEFKNVIIIKSNNIDKISEDFINEKTAEIYNSLREFVIFEMNDQKLVVLKNFISEIDQLPELQKKILSFHDLRLMLIVILIVLTLYLVFIVVMRKLVVLKISPETFAFQTTHSFLYTDILLKNLSKSPLQIKKIYSETVVATETPFFNKKIGKEEISIPIEINLDKLRNENRLKKAEGLNGKFYFCNLRLLFRLKIFIGLINKIIPYNNHYSKLNLIEIMQKGKVSRADDTSVDTNINDKLEKKMILIETGLERIENEVIDLTNKFEFHSKYNREEFKKELLHENIERLKGDLAHIKIGDNKITEKSFVEKAKNEFKVMSDILDSIHKINEKLKRKKVKLDTLNEILYQLSNFLSFSEVISGIKNEDLMHQKEKIEQSMDTADDSLQAAQKVGKLEEDIKNADKFRKSIDWENEKSLSSIYNNFFNQLREHLIVNFVQEVDLKLGGIEKEKDIEDNLKKTFNSLGLQEISPKIGEVIDMDECEVVNKEAYMSRVGLQMKVKEIKARGIKIDGKIYLKAKVRIDA